MRPVNPARGREDRSGFEPMFSPVRCDAAAVTIRRSASCKCLNATSSARTATSRHQVGRAWAASASLQKTMSQQLKIRKVERIVPGSEVGIYPDEEKPDVDHWMAGPGADRRVHRQQD